MNQAGDVAVLVDTYAGLRFNEPNDLWVTPDDGVYFSDPVYNRTLTQDGEHVYYIPPEGGNAVRVIDDLVRPNGIIGSPDGKTQYVTDHGAGVTYSYEIENDGTLSHRQVFVSVGADGHE